MKTELFTIDSSVIISMLIELQANHSDSKNFIEYVMKIKGVLIVPMIIFFETFHTLKRLGFFDVKNAHETFIQFCNYSNFKFLDLNMKFFNHFKQADCFSNLKTSDAIIASAAFLTESTLISWDRQLIKNTINAYTPTGFLNKLPEQ